MIDSDTLHRTWLFADVGERGRRELLARAIEVRFAARQQLFRAGEPARGLYVILEGVVRVVRGSPARQHVVHTEGPGGTLGEVPIFDGRGYPATAVAIEPTRCLLFTPDAIRAAIGADPEVAMELLRRLAGRVRSLVDRLDDRARRSTLSRLAAYLWRHRDPATGTVRVGMTQSQLAEELGTVREVVVRDLRTLKRRACIRNRQRGVFEILDAPSLEALAADAAP